MSEPCVFIKIDREGRGFHPIAELPFHITAATIRINYASREPVKVDLKAEGPINVEIMAQVETIEISGKLYRLQEVGHFINYGINAIEDREPSK